jgi:prevent-host-death family protein
MSTSPGPERNSRARPVRAVFLFALVDGLGMARKAFILLSSFVLILVATYAIAARGGPVVGAGILAAVCSCAETTATSSIDTLSALAMSALPRSVPFERLPPIIRNNGLRRRGKNGLFGYNSHMSGSPKSTALPHLGKLPRARASDVKKLGWRGMMNAIRSKGKILVTNHDEPEAVILPAAEYDALMQLVAQSEARAASALEELRQSFDERLSALQERSAATRLRSSVKGRVRLSGKVKAGASF